MRSALALLFVFVLLAGCKKNEGEPRLTSYLLEYQLTGYAGWYNITYRNETGGTNSIFINLGEEGWKTQLQAKSEQPFFMSANCRCSNANFTVEVYANGTLLQKSLNKASSGGDVDVIVSGQLK